MPELPRRIKRHEADFGLQFRHWAEANKKSFPPSCSFELKDTAGKNSLAFDAWEPKQSRFAHEIQHEGSLIRVTVGTPGTADYLFMKRPSIAFVVIKFPDQFCIIKANDLIAEKESSKRKSLTAERAKEIAEKVVELPRKKR